MPLFQYLCANCENESEVLVRGREKPVCPKCGSGDLVQQASRFNALNGGSAAKQSGPAPCGLPACCGGGACGLN